MKRLVRLLQLATTCLLLYLASSTLWRLSQTLSWQQIQSALVQTPPVQLLYAIILAMLNHAILMTYDLLAFRLSLRPFRRGLTFPNAPQAVPPASSPRPLSTGSPEQPVSMSPSSVASISLVAYVFSHCLGMAALSGNAVRLRFYTAAGVGPARFLRLMGWVETMVWMGYLPLLSLLLWAVAPVKPPPVDAWPQLKLLLMGMGALVTVMWPALAWGLRARYEMPSVPMACLQMVVSAFDWMLNALVLAALLPSGIPVSPLQVVQIFMLVQVIGIVSQMPGGVGVFEGAVMYALAPEVAAPSVVASLLLYRVIYYLLPMLVALPVFVRLELARRRQLRAP